MLTGLVWDSRGRADGLCLSFSKGQLGPQSVLDSSTSPPARYLIELGRRLLQAVPDAQYFALANPLLPVPLSQLGNWLQGVTPTAAVISDQDQFPLFYLLPRQAFVELERYLLPLSTVDAAIDQRFLSSMLGVPVAWHRLPGFRIGDYPLTTSTGWFQGRERQKVLKVLAANAIRIFEGNRAWRDIPSAVYHPYHAGSIVFFAAAAATAPNSLFRRHVICSTYKDIVAAADHRLEPLWLRFPWLPRDNSVGEPHYFSAAMDRLGDAVTSENFLVFMRYSRMSGFGPFHLVDHDRFSLGESLAETGTPLQEADASGAPGIARASCRLPTTPLRVLFHITGGLPIKNYPLADAKRAIQTLRALDIHVSVIGRPDLVASGAVSIEADETDLLSNAVREHHIFVGLDSFPHHFVRNILGWPTIGLFGTTAATNFGGGWNDHYRTLDSSLPCHPCGAEKQCPVFAQPECVNYARPQALVAAILEMAGHVYGYSV